MGYVYLIHFHRPISPDSPSQHYIGYADNLESRISYHHKGQSKVRLFEVAKEREIGFDVVYVWENVDKAFERKLKRRKNARKMCPVCRGET